MTLTRATDRLSFANRVSFDRVLRTKGDCYGYGYEIGKVAQDGDQLPHPKCGGFKYPELFYHGLRAALHPRGLQPSLFMKTIPL